MRPKYEVADIIRGYEEAFFSRYKVVPQVRNSFAAMTSCRTAKMGGHVQVCPECGEIRVSYNSCRDRHCPKCRNREGEQWIQAPLLRLHVSRGMGNVGQILWFQRAQGWYDIYSAYMGFQYVLSSAPPLY